MRHIEPYNDLVATVTRSVADPEAALPFAYDWRLSVATNARFLAEAAREHLERWRRHPAHALARKHRVDEREGRLSSSRTPWADCSPSPLSPTAPMATSRRTPGRAHPRYALPGGGGRRRDPQHRAGSAGSCCTAGSGDSLTPCRACTTCFRRSPARRGPSAGEPHGHRRPGRRQGSGRRLPDPARHPARAGAARAPGRRR